MNTPNSFNVQTNSTGETVVSPGSSNHSEVLTFEGAGGGAAREIVLNPVGRAAGDRIKITALFPSTPDITINFRNASTGGLLLEWFTTDGVQLSGSFDFAHTGGAWYLQQTQIPAFTE